MTWSAKPRKDFPVFICPTFFLKNEKPWCRPQQSFFLKKSLLELILKEISPESLQTEGDARKASPVIDWQWQEPDFESFSKTFRQLQQDFRKGALRKAVPVVFARSPRRPGAEQVLAAMRAQVRQELPGYMYGYWDEVEGILGLSPELLLRQRGRSFAPWP